MAEVLYYAIPFFVLLLAVEWLSFRHAHLHDHDHDHGGDGHRLVGYELADTRTSLTMGLGNVAINVVWKFAVVAVYVALYELTPLRIPADAWWAWVLLFFADDLAYYWFHRVSHESRVFWASHVVHHSSQHYNLSTALRQTWVPMTYLPFWLPLPLLGFEPWMVLLAQSWSLIYQFFLHTERVRKLPGWAEKVLNTPSHHRVHHGSNEVYLDRNYGGILVIWDRLFGTFEPEGERVRYGLTKNIETHNPIRVAFHEYIDLWRDVRAAPGARLKAEVLLRGPGFRPPSPAPAAEPAPSGVLAPAEPAQDPV
jgi:sterol desaturase/sphingolipid hydroxylase (fatty acid hydroxylase superfamily)